MLKNVWPTLNHQLEFRQLLDLQNVFFNFISDAILISVIYKITQGQVTQNCKIVTMKAKNNYNKLKIVTWKDKLELLKLKITEYYKVNNEEKQYTNMTSKLNKME